MKKILITGANSYIGESLEQWLGKWPEKYSVNTIDMIDGSWKNSSFSGYDAVFHVAGIAHVSSDPKMEDLYYSVNRDLTIETAKKAKNDGANQFIFMSSIIVYGDSSPINSNRIIDKNTIPEPANFYGDSKLQAENGIRQLEDDSFKVIILRPPMIYGKASRGNYPKLAKFATKLPFFPDINNQRSMLYIDNLCEFIRLMIDNDENGIYFPQNEEYVKTSELVRLISKSNGREIVLTKFFNPFIMFFGRYFGMINKVFGNLVYDKSISEYKVNYRICSLEESIINTENIEEQVK